MLLHTMALAVAVQGQGFRTDTTFSVAQGARLQVENQGGDITIRGWDRNQIRVQAVHSRRTRVEIRNSGAVVVLEAGAERGPANMVDYVVTVPAWMTLSLEGMYSTIDVSGVRGAVTAETLEGDITVKGPAENVKLESVQGRLVVEGIRGPTTLNTVSESIEASDIQGDIIATSVSGSITLRRIGSKVVEAETVSGPIILDGRVVDGGRYALLSHSGELLVTMPEGANATISTATGSGDVRATFPLPQSERPSRRRQNFRFGSGSATLELESFSGSIRLYRPSEMEARLDRMSEAREAREKRKPPHDREQDQDRLDQDRS
jgi:DUF4097 and DUF4098 domain-containing protein YvlB